MFFAFRWQYLISLFLDSLHLALKPPFPGVLCVKNLDVIISIMKCNSIQFGSSSSWGFWPLTSMNVFMCSKQVANRFTTWVWAGDLNMRLHIFCNLMFFFKPITIMEKYLFMLTVIQFSFQGKGPYRRGQKVAFWPLVYLITSKI